MTAHDITIPPEALEASAKAIWATCQSGTLAWEDLPSSTQRSITEEARAACLAMLRNWPGMTERFFPNDPTRPPGIFLPLPQENIND